MYKKLLLIDLDGVLNEYNGNFDENYIPPIKKGAKEFLAAFNKADYEIKIFTTRNKLLTSKWIIENGLDEFISDVTNVKESAYICLDDRCICFQGNFDKTLEDIESFRAYWKAKY